MFHSLVLNLAFETHSFAVLPASKSWDLTQCIRRLKSTYRVKERSSRALWGDVPRSAVRRRSRQGGEEITYLGKNAETLIKPSLHNCSCMKMCKLLTRTAPAPLESRDCHMYLVIKRPIPRWFRNPDRASISFTLFPAGAFVYVWNAKDKDLAM
jgi:hypothetical protein